MNSKSPRLFFPLALLAAAFFLLPGTATRAEVPENTAATLQAKTQYSRAALAPGTSEEISILITLISPSLPKKEQRAPLALSLVLDRSGSMGEAKKIDYARQAVKTVINSLEAEDLFSLVIYDDKVEVLHSLAKIKDKKRLKEQVDGVDPRGFTFLSGGLDKSIEQLQQAPKDRPRRVILLSDGLANRGVTEAEAVAAIGAAAKQKGLSISTIGLGLDFNEDLMQHLAQRGSGKYYYIQDSEDLPSVFKEELQLMEQPYTKEMQATFLAGTKPEKLKIYGYAQQQKDTNTAIELGDLSADENRQIMFLVQVKAGQEGQQKLGELRLNYIDLADGKKHDLVIPLELPILADAAEREKLEAASAEENKIVREEVMLLDAEEAHVAAVEEIQKGNTDKAKQLLKEQEQKLAPAAPNNAVLAGKMEQMKADAANIDQAVKDEAMQKEMSKTSKASQYMSNLGRKQGVVLQQNDKGFMVEKLQKALTAKGYYKGKADGVYSKELQEAVKQYQKDTGFKPDGIVGPSTRKSLGF